MAYRVPSAEDRDYQFQTTGFELNGWIVDPDWHRTAADDLDPLAASILTSPCRPTEQFADMLGITADEDQRTWYRADEPVLRSRMWNDTAKSGRGHSDGLSGESLEIRRDALEDLLAASGRSMIIEVMVNRRNEPNRAAYGEEDDDESFTHLENSFKVYLFDESGGCGEL